MPLVLASLPQWKQRLHAGKAALIPGGMATDNLDLNESTQAGEANARSNAPGDGPDGAPGQPAQAAGAIADAVSGNWVDNRAPNFAKPYLRLMRADRPIGTWLLLLPCWMGQALAGLSTDGTPIMSLWHAALFAVGAFVMRGAGCAYNDLIDRDIDAQVARTASRPIPAGQVTPRAAGVLIVALSLVGFAILLQFNGFTIGVGIASLGLVAAYPFMKRITWWPQAWLGLTLNWGVLVGYASATGGLSLTAIMLYAAGVAWTLGYDTIYACQDKEDDALIGVRSSALALGDKVRTSVFGFYAATILLALAAGVLAKTSPIFYLILIAPALHLGRQVWRFQPSDGALCLTLFRSNRDAGFLLLAPFLLAALVGGAHISL
ncbi:MAG: 4-hydroxybenzoate octaprenyltransferase [Pseudomonadota bacterium]